MCVGKRIKAFCFFSIQAISSMQKAEYLHGSVQQHKITNFGIDCLYPSSINKKIIFSHLHFRDNIASYFVYTLQHKSLALIRFIHLFIYEKNLLCSPRLHIKNDFETIFTEIASKYTIKYKN